MTVFPRFSASCTVAERATVEAKAVNNPEDETDANASPDAIAYLQTLPFTGNIRELKNLVERALLMKKPEKNLLDVEDFVSLASTKVPDSSGPDNQTSVYKGGQEGASLSSIERNAIAACIAKHNGNLSLVAKELGISRGALYRKIEKHGL